MNVSRVAGHGYSNHTLHHSSRFEKATVDVQGNNPATKVTISPEAQALNETKPTSSRDKIRIAWGAIKTWMEEIKVEALKNGTCIETAKRKYGMEIAKFIAENENDPESANEILEGITRIMEGQSFKDAFNIDDRLGGLDRLNDFFKEEFDNLENMLRRAREDYKELKKRGIDIEGVIFSFRYGCWISPPDNNAIQPEEVKEDVPQDKKGDKAAPQDKDEIFKDFAEQIIASHRKKDTKHSKNFLHLHYKFGVYQADNVS